MGVAHPESTDAILLINEGQTIVGMNPAAEQMLGAACDQVLGSPLEQFIPQRWRAGHAGLVRAFDNSPDVQRRLSTSRALTAQRADGQEFAVELVVSRIDLAGGAGPSKGYLARLRRPGEENNLREELASVQRRMQAIFELAPIAIWISDHEVVVFANQAAARLFGAPGADALRGRSIYELLAMGSHAAVRAQMEQAVAGKTDLPPVRGNVIRADGEVLEVEVAVAPLPDHGQTMVQMVVADITRQTRESAELERSRQALRKLSASVVEAREEERRRIARELHDELGQRLTALKMDLTSLGAGAKLSADDPQLAGMLNMLDDTLAAVRRLSTDLRPLMLDDLGLSAAIEWLARETSRRMGINVRLQSAEFETELGDKVSTALFRMVQEGLTNITRHAGATEVEIRILPQADRLVLTVSDNGVGFPEDALQREGSYGLLGMRERVQMLGGSLALENLPHGGGCLTVSLPFDRAAKPDALSEPGRSGASR
jgi:two-component system sensor histidine kinase UhpB